MLASLYRQTVISVARPYIRRELPGWGVLYRAMVGSFERDWLWQGLGEYWIRGKLHGHEMSLRPSGWSNRATFFLERFYDLPTQLLLCATLKEGDIFLDVGANEGMMTLLASRLVGPTGEVLAFEPNPVPREILERNLHRNGIANVEVHAVGLSDSEGELQLFVPRVNTGEGSFTAPDDASAGDYTACPVSTGDNVIGARRPRLIKIDVEGFESRVLRGLRETLNDARPVIAMEMIAQHLERDGQTPQGICDWLASLGYFGQRLGLRGRRHLALSPMPQEWADGDYVFVHHTQASRFGA